MKKMLVRLAAPMLVSILLGCSVWGSYIIPDGGVSTAKIAAGAVTSPKLASGAAIGNIANGTITRPQLPLVGLQASSSSGTYTTTSTTTTPVTNLSVTITTTGRPVIVVLQPDGTGGVSDVLALANVSTAGVAATVQFLRGGSLLFSTGLTNIYGSTATTTIQITAPATLLYIDAVGAGTYTYTCNVFVTSGTQLQVNRMQLDAYEL